MEICLINTNSNFIEQALSALMVNFQIGLLSLGAILEKNNHKVKIIDLAWFINKKKLAIDNNFHINAAKIITEQKIDILGFNSRCDSYPSVLNIAKKCKELNPNCIIIFGGPQATLVDIETIKEFPFVDIVIRGEGESIFPELLECLKKKQDLRNVPGITYKKNGRVIRNKENIFSEDLNSLPFPAYHLMDEYTGNNSLSSDCRIYISIGRGCPYNCAFCCNSLIYKRTLRLKSPQKIIDETLFLKEKYGVNRFILGQDSFLANREYVEKICELLVQKNINIKWGCSSRVDDIDHELIKKMSIAGCDGIYFGIESGSLKVRESIQKNINISRFPDILKECNKYNISTVASFIIGFPEEKKEDLNATLKLALECRQLNCFSQLHLFAPMPGTRLLERYKKRLIFTGRWSNMSDGPMARLQDNLNLIKKYPLIFSIFYEIRPRYLPLDLPYEIANVFFSIIFLFPITSYLIIKELKFTPLELLQAWKIYIKKLKKRKLSYKGFIAINLDIVDYFYTFTRDIYNKKKRSFDFLDVIAKLEKKRFDSIFNNPREYKQFIIG